MDGARNTSLAAAAMKSARASLRRISCSRSPETLASRLWRADPAAARERRRKYEMPSLFPAGGCVGRAHEKAAASARSQLKR